MFYGIILTFSIRNMQNPIGKCRALKSFLYVSSVGKCAKVHPETRHVWPHLKSGVSEWPICFVAIGLRAWLCTLVHSLRPQPQRLAS